MRDVKKTPGESTVDLCNIKKILKIRVTAHNWNIMSGNFVRHTKEIAGQCVSLLNIFISRLGLLAYDFYQMIVDSDFGLINCRLIEILNS